MGSVLTLLSVTSMLPVCEILLPLERANVMEKILHRISRQTENSKTEATLCSNGSSGKHSTLQYSHSTAEQNYTALHRTEK